MRIYIDSNTFPASPALYADAEKTKPLPRILPAVELQRGGFEVSFLGDNKPADGSVLALAASIENSQTQVVAEFSEDFTDGAWRFDFALNSEALVAEVAMLGNARLLVGVIAEDDAGRREWQFTTVVYPSASGEPAVEAVESAKDWAELAKDSATEAKDAQMYASADAQAAQEAKQVAKQAASDAVNAATGASEDADDAAQSKADAEAAKQAAEAAMTAAQKAASDAQATLANVYTKSEIDGVDTGAEVTLKMNEIIAQLKDYEEVTGEKLPWEFWEAVMAEFQRWQENPNEVKEWVTTSETESTNPYFSTPPTKPVVDFSVVGASGFNRNCPSFAENSILSVFLPEVSVGRAMAAKCNVRFLIAPLLRSADYLFADATGLPRVVFMPKLEFSFYLAHRAKCDFIAILPSAKNLRFGFGESAMSAENISKTLDSLPTWTDGGEHVVAFTGSPGASELTQESPSVAAATARGWTVEL